MSLLLVALDNATPHNIVIGAPTHVVGHVVAPLAPDPIVAGGLAMGAFRSDGNGDLDVTYVPQVAAPTPVDLGIAIRIHGAIFQGLTLDSSRPGRFTIDGVAAHRHGPGAHVFFVYILVGVAA